ncbi:hypothetical protein H257_01009 [Aphanomyces astaci]|uniref:SWIM-type domain-containing protein n=1 Tax=Aphanomyces astaci TaxID=112090 RepID=W4H689_APHAT|nr:hypothetical protein H257_01009 [Aphanomyces astaci]ETV87427.1 hypothetical protein H257_01009 [Aphanomyces astaci]|eukprot:XP_009822290.1 hypothetical protein H257_01009 [Aphanomyces astaci]
MAKAEWSSYVEKLWRASYSIMREWSFVHCDGDMWYVSDVALLDVTEARHHVELCPTGAFHTCNCYDFLSSMIPCVGICQTIVSPAVFGGIKASECDRAHAVDDAFQLSAPSAAPSNHSVSLDVYKKQVANNSHLYRLFMTNLAPFEDGVGDETVRGSLEPFRLPQDAALIALTFSDCPVVTALVEAAYRCDVPDEIEYAIKAFRLVEAEVRCHVGFLPRQLIKHKEKYNNKTAIVVEDYRNSPSKAKRDRLN